MEKKEEALNDAKRGKRAPFIARKYEVSLEEARAIVGEATGRYELLPAVQAEAAPQVLNKIAADLKKAPPPPEPEAPVTPTPQPGVPEAPVEEGDFREEKKSFGFGGNRKKSSDD